MFLGTRSTAESEPIQIAHEHIACALCGADNAALLFELGGHSSHGVYVNGVYRRVAGRESVVRCRDCGLVYVNPRFVEAPGIAVYSAEEEMTYYQMTQADRRVGNAELLQQIEGRLARPGRLLDVGCGDGLLLSQAQLQGWEAWGLEVSGRLVAQIRARHNPARIFHGALTDAAYPTAHFDAVVLCNVIEHLRDPGHVVAEIARITRPGGFVAVHTPNIDSLAARLRGPTWHLLQPFDHLYYFNVRTLRRLLEQHELAVVGSFALHGQSKVKRWLLTLVHLAGLRLDNGLGLLARRES